MVKSNVLDVDVVQSTTSSGTLTVNLSVTCPSSANGCNVNQVGSTYYLYGVLDGYYYCGLQMGNQSVQYMWTLNISATPVSLASGATVSVEISYFDTLPTNPTTRRLGHLHLILMVKPQGSSPCVWFRLRYSQSPRWV